MCVKLPTNNNNRMLLRYFSKFIDEYVNKAIYTYVLRQSDYSGDKYNVFWEFILFVSSCLFMVIVTVLLFSLSCDYNSDLYLHCYHHNHLQTSQTTLTVVLIFLINNIYHPMDSCFESSHSKYRDINFLPIYTQFSNILKFTFCYVYVFYYYNEFVRILVLTIINAALVYINVYMKPCSIKWVNVLRSHIYIHGIIAGIVNMNYILWYNVFNDRYNSIYIHIYLDPYINSNLSVKQMVLSIIISFMVFVSLSMCFYYITSMRYLNREYIIAKSFLRLEWQFNNTSNDFKSIRKSSFLNGMLDDKTSSHRDDMDKFNSSANIIDMRVLECLYALTFDDDMIDSQDVDNVNDFVNDQVDMINRYADQLISLIAYDNARVQYQALSILLNISRHEYSRRVIHKINGLDALFTMYASTLVDREKILSEINGLAENEVYRRIYQSIGSNESMHQDNQLDVQSIQGCCLGIIVNLSKSNSQQLITDLVNLYSCVDLFIKMISCKDILQSQRACLGLANISRHKSNSIDVYRCIIRDINIYKGVDALIICLYSQNVTLIRNACSALTNICVSMDAEVIQSMSSIQLIDKLIYIATSCDIYSYREVVALIYAMSCHRQIRNVILQYQVQYSINVFICAMTSGKD